jgi:hypothetical protein
MKVHGIALHKVCQLGAPNIHLCRANSALQAYIAEKMFLTLALNLSDIYWNTVIHQSKRRSMPKIPHIVYILGSGFIYQSTQKKFSTKPCSQFSISEGSILSDRVLSSDVSYLFFRWLS